ncbi:hypothetical protein AB0I72_19740 [Nocardiopsis sp. NPDC049922]|uniref:hypothetical protein n=1 Tax=Nocardiopsis sp. NPDC049922 TaxID=3155157 RepID=UPI0033E2DCF3
MTQLKGSCAVARDYTAEMTALVEARTSGSGWVPAVVAAQLVDHLRDADPGLLAGWLQEMAPHLLTDMITTRERSIRATSRRRAGAHAFAAAAGDEERLRSFAVTYAVDGQNTRRRVADMTGDDHRFVADSYAESANRARMLSTFHEVVARKVGRRRTADVMSEAEYDRLLRSLVRPPITPEAAA